MTTDTLTKGDLRILDPKKVRVRMDAFHRLQLEVGIEERYGPVKAVRSLPLTRPDEFISLQDDENQEIGMIPHLRELDAESRHAIEQDLELYYLKAQVLAIKNVENKNGLFSWEVVTNLGTRTIHIRDRQHIRPLLDGRTILTDIHEAKYEVPPAEKLDDRSRQWLEIEL